MNNAQWRKEIRSLTKEDLLAAGFTRDHGKVKAVCFVLAEYGDYETGTKVKPAWKTVAREASVSRTFAHRVRDWLKDSGRIIVSVVHEANIEEYVLNVATEQLSMKDVSVVHEERAVVHLDGHNSTSIVLRDSKEEAPAEPGGEEEVTTTTSLVNERSESERSDRVPPVPGQTIEELLEEQKERRRGSSFHSRPRLAQIERALAAAGYKGSDW